jgi:RNA polymerase sigma factor (sigma-70 family)
MPDPIAPDRLKSEENALLTLALRIGRQHAGRCRLSLPDVEDCGADFVACLIQSQDGPHGIASVSALPELDQLTWLHRCARRHALDFARKVTLHHRRECLLTDEARARERRGDGGTGVPNIGYEIERSAFWDRISHAMKPLPLETQFLMLACYRDGQSVEEAARELGLAAPEASRRLYRGKARLRRCLDEQELREMLPISDITPPHFI